MDDLCLLPSKIDNREIGVTFTANDKRQIKVENFSEQKKKYIKTVQNDPYGQNWCEK